jgi:hypothetical protein
MTITTSQIMGTALGVVICCVVSGLLAALIGQFAQRLSFGMAVTLSSVPAPLAIALLGPMVAREVTGFGDWLNAWHLADVIGLTIMAGASLLIARRTFGGRKRPAVRPETFS